MWADRQVAKAKTKFAEEWLAKLEEKTKKSELKEEVPEWQSTQARNDFERARRLLEEKKNIQKKIGEDSRRRSSAARTSTRSCKGYSSRQQKAAMLSRQVSRWQQCALEVRLSRTR